MNTENDLQKHFINYSIALASISIIVFFDIVLNHHFSLLLLTTILLGNIILNALVGDIWSGLTTVFLSTLVLVYASFFDKTTFSKDVFENSVNICLFVFEGILTAIFVGFGKDYKKIIEIKEKEKEYLIKIDALEKEYEKAQLEIAARDEFLSIASHELKTPLTSVLLQIQTALYNIRSVSLAQFSVENLLQMLLSTENQTKRLSKMINDFLNISLITSGRMELELEEVNLTTLLEDLIMDFATRLEMEGYTIQKDIQTDVVGRWDKLRLEQAITNIIQNAIKYGNKKPLHISLKKKDSEILIQISDKGIGIPRNQKEKIFELFQRASTAGNQKGLGVGLYITNQIVKLHGGEIKVYSEVNSGSTFAIHLPI